MEHTNAPIPTLRPNYVVADFKPGQSVVLRYDGGTGVPKFMHGERGIVIKATTKRLIVVRVDGRDNRQLRITPNQVATIVEEPST